MARTNKLGNSFMGMDMEPREDKALKTWLEKTGISGKNHVRNLIRKHLKENKLL